MIDEKRGKGIAKYVIAWCFGFVVFALLWTYVIQPVDSTDRSGVVPVLDAATGVWYLKTNDGGLTPRLNADGGLYTEK